MSQAPVNRCYKCRGAPSQGEKLRACGKCLTVKYCSSACQVADWAEHKRTCASSADERKRAIASMEGLTGPGGGKKSLDALNKAVNEWYFSYRGLHQRVHLLAWRHRVESPLIIVTTPSLSHSSNPKVEMVPRRGWEKSSHNKAGSLSMCFGRSDFDADQLYALKVAVDGAPCESLSLRPFPPTMRGLHSSVMDTVSAEDYATEMVLRSDTSNSVHVRLTGLRGDARLNGREGTLRGQEPGDCGERRTVVLEDGTSLNVLPRNFIPVPRLKLQFHEFYL
mmetsp:Transcript_1031/g.2294  ORF Transcript_1031/g.2294 Transcript_1031/m.2294 type:complete len:279 (-) Transcript_1031:223-1059(-)|eukprot:CAMPEP_0181355980 /NCGR_PEP_ID=MMETSP1106-20121128/4186_1 /TAXON_ID=81844 /ORGANISM="Mantoniella antarctica, Strain SL-175" /LENGTH=278 /DNA_ID=CAMNT_0023468751 /DNA_START=30 /DNA_END=866 /DNA_ORIENTATION=-